MLPTILNPFQSLAAWLVSLLPAGAGDLATGATVMLGILLVLAAIVVPIGVVGALLEHNGERYGRDS